MRWRRTCGLQHLTPVSSNSARSSWKTFSTNRGTKGKPSYFLCEAQNEAHDVRWAGLRTRPIGYNRHQHLVLCPEDVPQSSHTLYFGFLERGRRGQ